MLERANLGERTGCRKSDHESPTGWPLSGIRIMTVSTRVHARSRRAVAETRQVASDGAGAGAGRMALVPSKSDPARAFDARRADVELALARELRVSKALREVGV